MISPFLSHEKLVEIYGSDLLADKDLLNDFEQLCGIQDVKPFDCVGTRDEVKAALGQIIEQRLANEQELPFLLTHSLNYFNIEKKDFDDLINEWNDEHFLLSEFEASITKAINTI